MLHELLLSLSGHPSPLLDRSSDIPENLRSLVSPAELALLESLARDLGEKHKSIRDDANAISSSHPSTACRAVASAIISAHLAAFQKRILEVERDILKENASLVGAYNIVPLSAIGRIFRGMGQKIGVVARSCVLYKIIGEPFDYRGTEWTARMHSCHVDRKATGVDAYGISGY